jgi:LPXTG-motif cell wall-anchored protein
LQSDGEKRAIPILGDDDDDDDDEMGDITDVWDEARLKAALGELRTDEASGPATASKRDHQPSVQIADELSPSNRGDRAEAKADTDPPPPPATGSSGLFWPLTLGLAVVLFAAAYFLVKAFR